MSDSQENETEEKPLSYTDKLLKLFDEDDRDEFTISEVKTVINKFRKTQDDNRRSASNKLPFGKYKFRTLSSVAKFDMRYLKWLSKQTVLDNFPALKVNIKKIVTDKQNQ